MRDRASDRAEVRSQMMQEFAIEIDRILKTAPAPSAQWAALMLTVGTHETNFDTKIIEGECSWERRECDAATIKGVRIFRARGAFQNHRNLHNAELWDAANNNVAAQVKMADDGLRRAFNTCRNAGVPFPQSALRAYAGSSCTKPMRGEGPRLVTYQRLLRLLERRKNST